MEELQDDQRKLKAGVKRVVAKGERAAEEIAETVSETMDDLKQGSGEIKASLRNAGEQIYEEVSGSVFNDAWTTVSDVAAASWQTARARIERHPVRSTLIALGVGALIGGILASRE